MLFLCIATYERTVYGGSSSVYESDSIHAVVVQLLPIHPLDKNGPAHRSCESLCTDVQTRKASLLVKQGTCLNHHRTRTLYFCQCRTIPKLQHMSCLCPLTFVDGTGLVPTLNNAKALRPRAQKHCIVYLFLRLPEDDEYVGQSNEYHPLMLHLGQRTYQTKKPVQETLYLL